MIVLAGVPSIMQAMLDQVGPKLGIGIRLLWETVRADARERCPTRSNCSPTR